MAKAPLKKPASSFNPSLAPEGLEDAQMPQADGTPMPQAPSAPQQARVYQGTQHVEHDLFKLENASFKRNVAYEGEMPEIDLIVHSHHFHTVDSSGKTLDISTAVGGHFHPITVKRGTTGVPEIEVGPPMRIVTRMHGKRRVKVMQPVAFEGHDDNGNRIVDTHTHKTTYKGSLKVMKREASVEAARVEATMAMKRVTSVEGVTGG